MRAFVDDIILDSFKTIEDDCAGSALDVVDGELADEEGGRDGDSPPRDVTEDVSHFRRSEYVLQERDKGRNGLLS